ncbi:carbohydrate-binding module family 13 protein, partial [Macrolepiota fuliginosa MF-IS2]
ISKSGETSVRLANTTFWLDAGTSPTNGTPMKIWTCFDNLPAQEWFYTGDDRIALFNQGRGDDARDLTNTNIVQTFKCTNGNTNQTWSSP